jgi:hypothetical protein
MNGLYYKQNSYKWPSGKLLHPSGMQNAKSGSACSCSIRLHAMLSGRSCCRICTATVCSLIVTETDRLDYRAIGVQFPTGAAIQLGPTLFRPVPDPTQSPIPTQQIIPRRQSCRSIRKTNHSLPSSVSLMKAWTYTATHVMLNGGTTLFLSFWLRSACMSQME